MWKGFPAAAARSSPVRRSGRGGASGSAAEPPPLTMSFGGSFARGSMDAGVMDEDEASTSSSDLRPDTVVVHRDGAFRFVNAAGEAFFGHSAAELLGRPDEDNA